MPPISTQSTLLELLAYPDPNIYRHAMAILKHINQKAIEEQKRQSILAMNTASDTL